MNVKPGFTYTPEGDTEFDRRDAMGISSAGLIRGGLVKEGLARPVFGAGNGERKLPWWGQSDSRARREANIHRGQFLARVMEMDGHEAFMAKEPDGLLIVREIAPEMEPDFAKHQVQ